jgi:hypothetical protein
MAIIIGAGTTVSFGGACVISANWGYNPNTQRLYCIGEWSPSYTYDRPTQTLSMSIYSGTGGPIYNTSPTESCTNANQVSASVFPAACGDSVANITGDWFVNSYGFSKDDPLLPGQETWGMQRWVTGQYGNTPVPTYVIRGISEGSGTKDANDADPGILFTGVTTESQSGNVTAGGIGRNDTLTLGVTTQVGGSESPASGKIGQGSVSMPYTPLWI